MRDRTRFLSAAVFASAIAFAFACNDSSPTSPKQPTPAPISTPRPGADLAGIWSGLVTELPSPDGGFCKTDPPTPVQVTIFGTAGQFQATIPVGGGCINRLIWTGATDGNEVSGHVTTTSAGCDLTAWASGTATASAIHVSSTRLHGECEGTVAVKIDLTR